MGKEVSTALEKEQSLREMVENALSRADEEVQRLSSENENLRKQLAADNHRLQVVERRLAEAETSLFRTRKDAQSVLNSVSSYDEAREWLDKEAISGPDPDPSTVEQSIRARHEA